MLGSSDGRKKGKAQFAFVAQAENQISLQAGQVIDIISVGAKGGWSKGVDANGKQGFFPSDYVKLIENEPVLMPVTSFGPSITPIMPITAISGSGLVSGSSALNLSASGADKLRAKVLYTFSGTGPNEMKLQAGQIIDIVQRGAKGGWSKGVLGAFPTDYVEFLPPEPAALSAPMPVTAAGFASGVMMPGMAAQQPAAVVAGGKKDISSVFDELDALIPVMPTAVAAGSGSISIAGGGFAATTALKPVFAPAVIPAPHAAGGNTLPVSSNLQTQPPPPQAQRTGSIAMAAAAAAAATAVNTDNTINNNNNNSNTRSGSIGAGFTSDPFASVSAAPFAASAGKKEQVKDKPMAVAKFARQASGPTEISIEKGDVIEVSNMTDKDWWYGTLQGRSGLSGYFPSNYVELRTAPVGGAIPPPPANKPPPPGQSGGSRPASTKSMVPAAKSVRGAVSTEDNSFDKQLMAREMPEACLSVGLAGDRYACKQFMDSNPSPIWKFPFVLDMCVDAYKKDLGMSLAKVPSILRLRSTMDALYDILRYIDRSRDMENEAMRSAMAQINDGLRDLMDTCRLLPERSEDSLRFFTFLISFSAKIRGLRLSSMMMVPLCWTAPDESSHALIMIVQREGENPDRFSAVIVSTDSSPGGGLDYHLPNVSNVHGAPLRKVTIELPNVSPERIQNTGFWFAFFRPATYVGVTVDAKYIYERLLPFLTGAPVQQADGEAPELVDQMDWTPISANGDETFATCLLESFRVISYKNGLSKNEAAYTQLMVEYAVNKVLLSDLTAHQELDAFGQFIAEQMGRQLANRASTFAHHRTGTNQRALLEIFQLSEAIEARSALVKEAYCNLPVVGTTSEPCTDCEELDAWGRFRRDVSVEKLAGVAPPPPIIRPVELTLVPDRVDHFLDMTKAMRHCLNLCVLLSNQRDLIRNSYTLRFCLIEHLFVRVIPIPLAYNHPDREKRCFWHTQPMRYETQADILRLLNMLCRHFATASLSVKITRSGDASRMLIFAVMATICDVTMRKIAIDVPSQSALHYSGMAKGPIRPFGIDLGNFAEESEYLKFVNPEHAAARTLVLDYFRDLDSIVPKENRLFRFNEGSECSPSDKKFIDQLCVQMGFLRNQEKQYLTGSNRNMLDHYPEIGFFRDIMFMFKLVMAPSSDQLPELKPWTPEEAALNWTFDDDRYVVKGFNRTLDCTQAPASVEEEQVKTVQRRKGFFRRILRFIGLKGRQPRALPSQANPSVLLGERVDTEDDILHILKLPDFDGTLGAKDCELMLQYLTAPYLRIPLLLTFFANEVRLKALRNPSLQEVLDATLFEPGPWQQADEKTLIVSVPAETRDHLCAPAGLLFNELTMSPTIVLKSIQTMLERVVDMDTGKYSALSESILYVLRLVVKVESYILFMVKNRANKVSMDSQANKLYGAAAESDVRGLECSDETLDEAITMQRHLRSMLHDQVFKVLARWIKHAKDDGQIFVACKLHAHLAYMYKNIEPENLNTMAVFAMLSCQIFLFNNYKYNLDLDDKDLYKKIGRKDEEDIRSDLGIAQIELFGLFQVNRVKIMKWLESNPEGANEIMNSLVEMVEESEQEKLQIGRPGMSEEEAAMDRKWMSIEQAGINFRGRFVPTSEYDPENFTSKLTAEARVSFEAWLREVTTLSVSTEINVQLGEFTIKKHVTQPLESDIAMNDDFLAVFQYISHNDIIQCAEVKNLPHRRWWRLVGLNHDVQYWDIDTRRPQHGYRIAYGPAEPAWVHFSLDGWLQKVFPGIDLFCGPKDNYKTEVAVYYGLWPPEPKPPDDPNDGQERTLKEVIVRKYPRTVEIYNIIEYGRRWYRTLVFASAPTLAMTALSTHAMIVNDTLCLCSGDPTVAFTPSPTVMIIKYPEESLNDEMVYLPDRLLQGTLPDCLLKSYQFWQCVDDRIVGLMNGSKGKAAGSGATDAYFAKSNLTITLRKFGGMDSSGFGFSAAYGKITRTETEEGSTRGVLTLLNPFSLLVTSLHSANSNNSSSKHLVDRFAAREERANHALVRMMLRLDSLANILFWTKSTNTLNASTIDLIELPRLRLTFERVEINNGTQSLYNCLEQPGFFITDTTDLHDFASLVDRIPGAVLLKNALNEHLMILSSLAKPMQYRIKKGSPSFKLLFSFSDQEWTGNCGEVTYFSYPLHISNTRLQSKSIAATFYLLAIYLMTQNYTEAFQLINGSVCDRPLTPLELQIHDLVQSIRDKLSADSAACRLKLYFVTYGCTDFMPFKYNIEEDLEIYLTKIMTVSSACRLTVDEEFFVFSNITEKNFTVAMSNRERLMRVTFESRFQRSAVKSLTKNFSPIYPNYAQAEPYHSEVLDFDSLTNTDLPTFKSALQKLTIVKYTKPEPSSGQQCMDYFHNVFTKEKNVGFFVLYELMGNFLSTTIIPDVDKPSAMGSVLLHLLPDGHITGLQRLILLVMENHQNLTANMPVFEDKRRLKLPTFAGLDIFQSHIKAAAAYLKTNKAEINMVKLRVIPPQRYHPPPLIVVSPAVTDPADFAEGRIWFKPYVKDYTCEKRSVSLSTIPTYLKQLHSYLNDREIGILTTAPLMVQSVASEIGFLSSTEQERYVGKKPPVEVTVLNHPSSRSHIARTSLTRLQQDMSDFYADVSASKTAFLQSLPLDISSLQRLNFAVAIEEIMRLKQRIESMKQSDVTFVQLASKEVAMFCNGRHPLFQQQDVALAQILGQQGHFESYLSFDFLATCAASNDATADLTKCNPFLAAEEADGVLQATLLCMLVFSRISQANVVLQQLQAVLKTLKALAATTAEEEANKSGLLKELLALSELAGATISMPRNFCRVVNNSIYEVDPRFLLFEFCHGITLRPSQVVLVRKLLEDMQQGRSVCNQMIMGAGKTTVVGPLLAMLLATEKTLIVEVVPPALLEFSASVLRERFSLCVSKTIFTFSFDRYQTVTPLMLAKLEVARNTRAVLVTTPSSVKSFMLKFLELCHNLGRQRNLQQERREKTSSESMFSMSKVRSLLGLGMRRTASSGELTPAQVMEARSQLTLCDRIFNIFRDSVEIMDEVDIILHPLKSELNWPLGLKEPLDFTRSKTGNGLRWSLPSHLLDAIFGVCNIPMLADISDSRMAVTLLSELKTVVEVGFEKYYFQQSPHLALLSKDYYHSAVKGIMARWLLLWLRAKKVPSLTDDEILQFLVAGNRSNSTILNKIRVNLGDEQVKMLNLGHDWLESYLPFVLTKINRVHFGLLQPHDLKLLEDDGVKVPTSRKLVAVPFVAKDVPSRASEFAHPDVLIGLTILAYRYEGLRQKDFFLLLRQLKECLDDEGGPYKDRPTFQKFEHWILTCGRGIRGSKKKPRAKRPSVFQAPASAATVPLSTATASALVIPAAGDDLTPSILSPSIVSKPLPKKYKKSLFGKIFDIDEDLIWPLQLIDVQDREQFRVLYPLLFKLPHAVMYYLNDLIFPEVLAYQGLKLSACGQELGGDMLFGRKIGFSGTPSDILPLELGSCQYERGSDGKVVHYLTSTDIVKVVPVEPHWDAKMILRQIATTQPPFLALIDTGALITGLSNRAAADYLLSSGLPVTIKGVVFLDEYDRQMVLLRRGRKVVKLADCGLALNERFSFYDHVHTTGMDIKQAVDARAALTLGKDMVFRDYAQGAFRMRGIGKGQTIHLLVTPEVADLIAKNVSLGSTGRPAVSSNNNGFGDVRGDPTRFLKEVLSWLVINSMRVDGVQYSLLCEQSVCNIWRKSSFNFLLRGYREIDSAGSAVASVHTSGAVSSQLARALQVFRERINFEIENAVPVDIRYSEKIRKMIEEHGDLLSLELDRKTATFILQLIREEEAQSDALRGLGNNNVNKQQQLVVYSSDAVASSSEAAEEQSFNREQVQEQEQEQEQQQEQEKEKEKEEEKIDELEEEEFVKQKYARDDEDPTPWPVEGLKAGPVRSAVQLGFYPVSTFSVFTSMLSSYSFTSNNNNKAGETTLKFPEFLQISRNVFNPAWSLSRTPRRIKNCIMVLEWSPALPDAPSAAAIAAAKMPPFTAEQEGLLLRCFTLFDLDEDGKLTTEDLKRALEVMGVDTKAADTAFMQYSTLIGAKGGFTFGVFKELIRDISSQFRRQEGRYFSLLSLEEAEHFRSFLHARKGKPLIPSEDTVNAMGSQNLSGAALHLLSDYSAVAMERSFKMAPLTAAVAQQAAMANCYRFLNNDAYFEGPALALLLRVFEQDLMERREKFYMEVRSCRRRRQVPLDGSSPVQTIFITKTEFEFLEFKAVVQRVKAALAEQGLLLFDAFRAFNSSHSGLLSCAELYGGLDYLGVPFTPQQLHALVRRIAVQTEGLVSYEDFKRVFGAVDDDEQESRGQELGGASSLMEEVQPKAIAELVDLNKPVTRPEDEVKLTEDLLALFKVKIKPIAAFSEVWNSQGTQSSAQVSLWAPSTQTGSIMGGGGRARICLGHYGAKGFNNPLKGSAASASVGSTSGGVRLQLIEITNNAATFKKGRAVNAVVAQYCPFPVKYRQVWHLARGAKSLYAWRAQPPDGFVALGMLMTNTEDPPDVRAMRCIPQAWAAPSKMAPVKLWDDTGAGGGRPGSIWVINSLGLIAVVPGHTAPTEPFWDLTSSRFFLN